MRNNSYNMLLRRVKESMHAQCMSELQAIAILKLGSFFISHPSLTGLCVAPPSAQLCGFGGIGLVFSSRGAGGMGRVAACGAGKKCRSKLRKQHIDSRDRSCNDPLFNALLCWIEPEL